MLRFTRKGFTLVELIVVLAIIVTLAALTALMLPRVQEQEQVNRGADMLQGWLLIAKQRARRDGLPTGLRFTFTNNATTGGIDLVTQYIQQPDDIAQGHYLQEQSSNFTAVFDVNFTDTTKFPSTYQIQYGDYLLIGDGIPRKIQSIGANPNQNQLILVDNTNGDNAPIPSVNSTVNTNAPTNYRIILSPRPIPGEEALALPEEVTLLERDNTNNIGCLNLAMTGNSATQRIYQILFSPSGGLVGTGTTNAQVIFWVYHTRPGLENRRTLIAVQPRTGFIAAHPVSSSGDPYSFTKDARSSGL